MPVRKEHNPLNAKVYPPGRGISQLLGTQQKQMSTTIDTTELITAEEYTRCLQTSLLLPLYLQWPFWQRNHKMSLYEQRLGILR